MSDRELLELAAKAAGYVIEEHVNNGSFWVWVYPVRSTPDADGDMPIFKWNPLTDDGDALRLVVKLNLRLVHHPVLNQVLVRPYHSNEWEDEVREDCEKHPDPYAATRRAIVRASAAIGKEMK